jgi:hypothetical protein
MQEAAAKRKGPLGRAARKKSKPRSFDFALTFGSDFAQDDKRK